MLAYDVPLTGLGGGTAVVFASGYLSGKQGFGLSTRIIAATVGVLVVVVVYE